MTFPHIGMFGGSVYLKRLPVSVWIFQDVGSYDENDNAIFVKLLLKLVTSRYPFFTIQSLFFLGR